MLFGKECGEMKRTFWIAVAVSLVFWAFVAFAGAGGPISSEGAASKLELGAESEPLFPVHQFAWVRRKYSTGQIVRIHSLQYGYIERTGKIVIKPQFDEASSFAEGLARVGIGKKWGYIDRTGKIVISPQFDDAWSFSGGLAEVKVAKKWGYIDRTGEIAIKPQFDEVSPFAEGLAKVKVAKEYGYIDRTGKMVISPQFDVAAYSFSEGLAHVHTIKRGQGYIDKTGRHVWAEKK